ncbi:hypothetical protein FSP39_018346 [Pinctada imbricata]|uniref:TIR domain-containing protein n=1 Tax=Pinctada imbricata TaxID=66713 RepID=A0AA88Y5Z0_PINIB|nr:hypothetical protein FSP39_018346 [Pinctada imbricata]
MSISRINTILLGHSNIFQKGPWKNDIYYANSFRETIQADLPKHADCLHSAYNNILAFLKNAETRGHSECRKICEQILKKDPQNINANLQLYDISGSKEEKERILVTVGDIISSVSKDHNIGVALIELGTALSTLIPKYYEHDTEDAYDEEIATVFDSHSEMLEFKSDVTNLDIPWRNELDDSGIYNHEAKNVYRWYNAVIYLKEGLYHLRNSHVVSSSELEIYRFSLAQASNRLSNVLLSSGGADYQRDHYSNASMRCFCEVVNQLDHTRYGFYVSRAFAYLGLMIQKKKNLEDASLAVPEIFRRLTDLERIWKDPEEAYNIAVERFEPDIVVCTRYGKFLVNARRYDEAISELQKMTQLSPCEKWFPNYVMMSAYFFKYVKERDECQNRGQPLSTNAKEFLGRVLEYGSICKKGQSTMEALYHYAKALFWAGTEFSPSRDMILTDEGKVKDALDVIKMIYEEYRNQDLSKIYKLHAECSKSLGNLEDSLHYMVCSFNASRRDPETVLPSFKYLCLYGLGLAQSSDVPESTKTLALRYVKFAIEDEVRFCHFRFKDPDAAPFNDVDATVIQSILKENISSPLCKNIGTLEIPPCRRWYSIYKEVRKLCDKFPEEMKLLLEYIHEKFMFVVGTQTMKVLTLICLGKDHKDWTRWYNRKYPRTVNIHNPVDVSLFFKPMSILRKGNSRPVCTDLEYDFSVIHSPHEQDFVACHLRQELEEGLERFKGCIFERDAPRGQSVGDFLENVLTKSNRIIIVISSFFLTHTLIRLQRVLKRLEEMKDRLIPIKVEAVEEDDRLRWLFGDVIDGARYPINWLQHPQQNPKTPNAKTQSRQAQKETQKGQGTSTHRNIKHKGLHINQRDQWATGADLGRPSATEIAEGNYSMMLRSMRQLSVKDNGESELPCYKMDARPRGKALIINNIQFHVPSSTETKLYSREEGEPSSNRRKLNTREGAHIDENDVLTINNPNFKDHLHEIYPHELEIKETKESIRSASYLDILLSFDANSQLNTSLYDKRDDFSFHISNFPFMSSNIPSSPAYGVFASQLIRHARACSKYEDSIIRARRLASKLLVQGYITQRLKSSLRKFFGRYGCIIKAYQIPLPRMISDIPHCD